MDLEKTSGQVDDYNLSRKDQQAMGQECLLVLRAENEESGSSHVRDKRMQNERFLLVELQAFENQGVSIWLDGCPSNSEEVSQAMTLREPLSYMRDYVFSEGKVSQIHFDRIDCE